MRRQLLAAWLLLLSATPGLAEQRLALLPAELDNTSMEPTRPDETARVAMLDQVMATRFAEAGFAVVDPAPLSQELAGLSSLRACNSCEVALGRKLGADLVAIAWVQKVSNLILNLNLSVRDTATGNLVAAGSVDIRGNTDESWRRGGIYLIDRRILPRLQD